MRQKISILLCAICVLVGCHRNSVTDGLPADGNAMYYWRTVLKLDDAERQFVKKHGISRLYVKFFDVVNDNRRGVSPVATLQFNDTLPEGVEVVPTVFIVENCLRDMPADLAEKVVKRVLAMCETNGIANVRELQVDCDWTLNSREKYFALLADMRQLLAQHGMRLSATIRLHQLSQPAPPVDYGALMVYNTADPRKLTDHNPILDIRDVEPYMKHLAGYKLPLATAYPLFEWQLLFNGSQFNRFIYGKPPVLKLTTDTLVRWQSDMREITRAKSAISKQRADASHLIILYHLDKQFISNYTDEDYEKIFSR
ncbi:MAG: hypothetical protein J5506_08460 [Prevotella sp.]|nr:hypothetical protein [Prevotella sp.]